jgi:hypothetical protein
VPAAAPGGNVGDGVTDGAGAWLAGALALAPADALGATLGGAVIAAVGAGVIAAVGGATVTAGVAAWLAGATDGAVVAPLPPHAAIRTTTARAPPSL